MTYFAHTGPGDWEPQERHLNEVADLAVKFADAFGAKEWRRLAGPWNDLRKYSQEFQRAMLLPKPPRAIGDYDITFDGKPLDEAVKPGESKDHGKGVALTRRI